MTMRTATIALSLSLALAVFSTEILAQSAVARLLAVEGMRVPGAETLTFSATEGYSGPSVNEEGAIVFTFGVRSGVTHGPAIWHSHAGELLMVGGPETTEIPRISAFTPNIRSTSEDEMSLDGLRRIILLATHNRRVGLWAVHAGPATGAEPMPIAIVGEPSPTGCPFDEVGGNPASVGNVSFRANETGQLLFQAVDCGTTRLWLTTEEATVAVASVGDTAPGLPGHTFVRFRDLFVAERGDVVFTADVASEAGARAGVWAIRDGEIQTIIVEEEPSPGALVFLSGPIAVNQAQVVAFVGERTEPNDVGDLLWVTTLYVWEPEGRLRIEADGEESIEGLRLDGIDRLALGDAGHLGMVMRGVSGEGSTHEAVVAQLSVGGELEILQTSGDTAPGGGSFVRFGDLVVNRRGGLAVEAWVDEDGKDLRGIYWLDDLFLERVVDTSTRLVDISGAEHVVDDVALFGFNHINRPFNRHGMLCFQAFLGDGSQRGIACAGIPEARDQSDTQGTGRSGCSASGTGPGPRSALPFLVALVVLIVLGRRIN